MKEAAIVHKASHAQEDAQAGKETARQVVEKLRAMRLSKAAEIVEAGVDETLSYYAMPAEALALSVASDLIMSEAKLHQPNNLPKSQGRSKVRKLPDTTWLGSGCSFQMRSLPVSGRSSP